MTTRKEAIKELAKYELENFYSLEKIEEILFTSYLDEEGETKEYNSIDDLEVQNFLIEYVSNVDNLGVSNAYLKNFLELKGLRLSINPEQEPPLHSCPCCEKKTLKEIGEHEICRVCFWEDKGIDLSITGPYADKYKESLLEAIENYKLFGACDKNSIVFVDQRAKDKFL